ncbi:dTMP kinase [Methanobacterium alcaliphilum]|uniref:dTMP kinase n=1 Tax=Methanobacterium alcaliphilum TaxID=392018 RepID=UPI00200AFF1B|nr:dTMP kinase [Methanobacterium alcaliphilum]MCK9152299.1 dTMP kinase [Methanobacterium alcaliphilum]
MYICLEGIDGAGKSTQVELLKEWLDEMGHDVERIVEPTSSEVGILIRKMLKNPKATHSDFQKTLGLLFAADRMILKETIEKAETENKIIISDRCFYSSMAYQNPLSWIGEINKYAKKPDLVVLLDLDVKTAVSRCQGTDEFEKKSFLTKVKKNYLNIAKKEDFFVINANNGVNLVHRDIKKIIAPHLGICMDNIL